MRKLSILAISAILLNSCSSDYKKFRIFAQSTPPEAVTQLVTWETKSNAVATRSNQMFDLYHYEIPLSLLKSDFAKDLDPVIKDSLVFEKNGEEYARWIINPEDTKWHLEVEKLLSESGLSTEKHTYLKGHLTASRSMIAYNPYNGAAFSIKVSTNNTGGNWKDKKQTWDDAKQIRKISDWTKDVIEKMETKNMVIMDEPLAMGIESLDQGLIVRNLNDVPQGTHYYLPGFSALHETTGRDIAKLNGEEDVAKFWRKNYAEPIGKALAEFSAYTGVYYDSPHSQNFMIELDQNKKPTGRIVLRDFGDAYLNRDFISQTAMSSILDIWEADNVIAGRYNTAVGFLHGNKAPTWLSTTEYQSWGKTFYKEYEKHFSEITGIEPATLKLTNITANNHYSYMSKRYQTTGSQWLRYFKYANCLNGAKVTITGEDCPDMFTKFQKTDTCMGIVNSFPH